ncbi:MAG: uroporphyrinogen decarboxylase family protein, partial [Propionibacteriaceae bacterium]|nr:uroporphyrinogen decarboxylase family protein [Propionibacteriaceae bacterium]
MGDVTLSPRQRLLAALRGEETDRLPWAPFPAYWWDRQPAALRAAGQVAAVERMGGDPLLRGRYDQG